MATLPPAKATSVSHGVELLGRINHPAAAQDQIERHPYLLK
jgi:hypothetical protein